MAQAEEARKAEEEKKRLEEEVGTAENGEKRLAEGGAAKSQKFKHRKVAR